MEERQRLTFVDGLRGVAVLGVMLSHSVWRDLDRLVPLRQLSAPRMVFDILAHEGSRGVNLFLVISGFCLAYPALVWRKQGVAHWFDPSRFFARRCLRILPPYYAVLALLVLVNVLFAGSGVALPPSMISQPLTAGNLISHVLLVHNLTSWYAAINGSFWSLALEWQWYFAFPLVLALASRSRTAAMVTCLLCGIAWHAGTNDLFLVWHHSTSAAPPEHLFEFCCGILAAQIVIEGQPQSRWWRRGLSCLVFLPLLSIFPGPYSVVTGALLGPPQAVFGLAFGALILLGATPGKLNALLSSRALTQLGIVSYSAYLIHQPVIEAVEMYAPGPLQLWFLAPVISVSCAIAAAALLHRLVERPCMHAAAWRMLSPSLMAVFSWTRVLEPLFVAHEAPAAPSAANGQQPVLVESIPA
jgi:peptidoglycan/LPS O-acetylase OafA/YrhL